VFRYWSWNNDAMPWMRHAHRLSVSSNVMSRQRH
jgi:hypothetical protein